MDVKVLTEYEQSSLSQRQPLPDRYLGLGLDEMERRIRAAKAALGDRLLILGHHYQRDEVLVHADVVGDSWKLSRECKARTQAEYVIFCGVHFMAESADILGADHQKVSLPDLAAGCSMADMADIDQLEICWRELEAMGITDVVPVTYINSSAAIKAFVGEHGGTICTSGNARATLEWAWARGRRILFMPDQHLGRNTAWKMGVPLEQMVVWDPDEIGGGHTPQSLADVRLLLWKGHCSVHTRFTVAQIANIRKQYPGHPRDRAPRGAAGRRPGRRRVGLHRVHPEAGARIGAWLRVGRRHRSAPREPPRQRSGARQDRRHARPVRVPLLDDVPGLAEPPALGARRHARGRRAQPDHRARGHQALGAGGARSNAQHSVTTTAAGFGLQAT